MKVSAQCSVKANYQKMKNERENIIVALCPSIKPYSNLIPWSAVAFRPKKNIME